MVATITYTSATGGRVTVLEGSPAQLSYARSRAWEAGKRAEAEVPAEPVSESPVDRAATSAVANTLAALSPEVVVAGSVGEVKAAVALAGPAFAAEVLELERSGRNRTSLVRWLTAQAGDHAAPAPELEAPAEEPEQADDQAKGEQPDAESPTEPGPTY